MKFFPAFASWIGPRSLSLGEGTRCGTPPTVPPHNGRFYVRHRTEAHGSGRRPLRGALDASREGRARPALGAPDPRAARRRAVRLAQHREVAGSVRVPQDRRLDPGRGRRLGQGGWAPLVPTGPWFPRTGPAAGVRHGRSPRATTPAGPRPG